MKSIILLKGIILIPLFFTLQLKAQQKISIDIGAVRQKNNHNTGMNLSGFYHFNKKLLGGIELNRFFPVRRTIEEENVSLSSWDVEMNIHYLFPLYKGWKIYSVTGISHTAEKELSEADHFNHVENFWSLNTGAGILVELGHFLPHVEYVFTWGQVNHQFILAGVGYEIEWGHHKASHAEKKK